MTTNVNLKTGIRFGVISGNSLDPDLLNDLFYGSQATDLSYQDAVQQLEGEIKFQADRIEEEATESISRRLGESITRFTKPQLDELCEDEIEAAYQSLGYDDRDDYIDTRLDREREHIQCDEPIIEGELDGVTYHISWLGGAPLVWVFEGPIGSAERLCSPCVPNAADLDGGFFLESELGPEHPATSGAGYFDCYCVPRDWLAKED